MYEHKAGRSSASRQSTDVLLQVLSERSTDLHAHLSDVARLTTLTAERLGLPDHEVTRIELAAELHDVGKTAIPDTILNKAGKLNDEEWGFMHGHTLVGERIVRAAPSLAHTADLVRSCHERFDGAGYPDGLAGDAIPLGASIIAVCDAFDAMVTDRPYRSARSSAEALAEVRRCSGTQFDPEVADAFCALADELVAAAPRPPDAPAAGTVAGRGRLGREVLASDRRGARSGSSRRWSASPRPRATYGARRSAPPCAPRCCPTAPPSSACRAPRPTTRSTWSRASRARGRAGSCCSATSTPSSRTPRTARSSATATSCSARARST